MQQLETIPTAVTANAEAAASAVLPVLLKQKYATDRLLSIACLLPSSAQPSCLAWLLASHDDPVLNDDVARARVLAGKCVKVSTDARPACV